MKRRPVLLGFAAMTVVALGVLALWLGRLPEVDVVTHAVTSGPIARQILATGTLEPVKRVDVGTQVSGTIESLEVDFNSAVRAGQVVARLDPTPYQTELAQARAALDQARARAAELSALLKNASVTRERTETLAARDLIARDELDSAGTTEQQGAAELKASQAAILAAEGAVRRAEVDLGHTVIRSPIDGIVVHRHVNVGETVAARLESPVLLTIADFRQMQLVAEIDEGEVGGVKPGTPVAFQVEALGGDTLEGHVADVRLQPYSQTVEGSSRSGTMGTSPAPAAAATSGSATAAPAGSPATSGGASAGASTQTQAPGVVSYRAIIEVNNDDGRLLPGGTAVVHLTSGTRGEAIRIPNAALAFAPSADVLEALGQEDTVPAPAEQVSGSTRDRVGRHARVLRYEDGRLVPVEIEIGVSDAQFTELLSGPVEQGDELVTRAAVR